MKNLFALLFCFTVSYFVDAQQLIVKKDQHVYTFSNGQNVRLYFEVDEKEKRISGKIAEVNLKYNSLIIRGYNRNSNFRDTVSVKEIIGIRSFNRTGRSLGAAFGTILAVTGSLIALDISSNESTMNYSPALAGGLIAAGATAFFAPQLHGKKLTREKGFEFKIE
ncbi:MAG: hypothetical protein MH132_07730 [Hydrotalea sp.]|nr:hypothetical protein [Hydrotalea sp.]